jgi:HAD superfamily hydrolase (TIGR01509 family)
MTVPSPRTPECPKAILFDLYETLVTHLDPGWTPLQRTVAGRLGVPEHLWAAAWHPLQQAWEAGAIETYTQALLELCQLANIQPDTALLEQLQAERIQRAARPFAQIEPAVAEVLIEMRRRGIHLAVVTNASPLDTQPWRGCALATHVDSFVASHVVRLLKPDPRIYVTACQQLGVEPHQAIFVGDGGSGELQGAADAGITAYWASWFIDRWPAGRKPNRFPNDEWREDPDRYSPPFPRLRHPSEVLQLLLPSSDDAR